MLCVNRSSSVFGDNKRKYTRREIKKISVLAVYSKYILFLQNLYTCTWIKPKVGFKFEKHG